MIYRKAIFILPILVCISQALISLNDSFVSAGGLRNTAIYPFQPRVYDINMDLNYEDRWREVMEDMGQTIPELYDLFLVRYGLSEDLVNSINYDMLVQYDEEYAKEVKAIANLINYPFVKVAFLNAFYDITTECTSIIVQDAQNNLIHGRNLDFHGMAPVITRMMLHTRFMKNDKIVYESITKIGQIGLLTGIKNGKFSISLNQNIVPGISDEAYIAHVKKEMTELYAQYKENYENSLENKKGFLKRPRMYLTPVYVARKAIETASSFHEMYDILKRTPTISRTYYILAGVNSGEGSIIQKDGDVTEDATKLNPDGDIWYLAVSNYVRSKPDPPGDNRVDAAAALLDSVGRANITKELLYEIMTTYPIFHKGTIHNSIMQAKTNLLNTTIFGWSDHRVATAIQGILDT